MEKSNKAEYLGTFMTIDLNKLCTLPWGQLSSSPDGSYVYCCEASETYKDKDSTLEDYWNSPYLMAVRTELIKGNLSQYCRSCLEKERNGLMSMRKANLHKFTPEEFRKHVDYSREHKGKTTSRPKILDIRFSNKCNMQCRMCYPDNSSAIYKEYLANKEVLSFDHEKDSWGRPELGEQRSWDIKELVSFCDDIQSVVISGGEPFLQKEVTELIEELVQTGKSQSISLQITTNGSIKKHPVLERLEHFKEAKVLISIDGEGPHYDYIRYPYKWDYIRDNIIHLAGYKSHKVDILLTPTIQVLNIMSITDLLRWADRHEISYELFTSVANPKYYSIEILPRNILIDAARRLDAYRVQAKLEHSQYRDINRLMKSLDFLCSNTQDHGHKEQRLKLKNNLKAYDHIRQQNYESVLDQKLVSLLEQV